MKYVVIVIPGMSDRPLDVLGGRTPLEQARGRGLGRLAARGRIGTARLSAEARRGSIVGLPALLGYDADRERLARGPLEAAGLGVKLCADDLALRLNFVSTFRGTLADTRAGHVSDREARVLLESLRRLKTRLDLSIHVGFGYRHLVVVRGGADLEVHTEPPQEALGKSIGEYLPAGRDSGPFVDFIHDCASILAGHDVNRVRIDLGENPADGVWLWGEGVDREIPSFGIRHGLRACMIAAAPLARGLAHKAGMACPELPGATGDLTTSLQAKRAAALAALERFDLVVVHVASANEASRARDVEAKVRALARLDRDLVTPLLEWVEADEADRRILVTSDHPTLVESDLAGLDPVPFAAVGGGLLGVRNRPFTEAAARAADLHFGDAPSLLEFFLGTRTKTHHG